MLQSSATQTTFMLWQYLLPVKRYTYNIREWHSYYKVGMLTNMGKKGVRSSEGQGEIWDESKSEVVSMKLTPTGKRLLDEKAKFYGLSKGEFIERIARGTIELNEKKEAEKMTLSSSPSTAITIDQILKALSRFSLPELTKILSNLVNLIEVKLLGVSTSLTIAKLAKQYIEELIHAFEDAEFPNPTERVISIIQGNRPTVDEITLMTQVVHISPDELFAMYRREFPNGTASEGRIRNHR